MMITGTRQVHPLDVEEGGKQAETCQVDAVPLVNFESVWTGLGTVLASTAEWISCRSAASVCNWTYAKKSASLAQVDLRGRPLSEVTTVRRPLFLGGGVCFDVPALTLDTKGAARTAPVGQMHEAPMSGSWEGKYFDGCSWRDAGFTLFFQDLSTYGKKKEAGATGFGGQDLMGSCAPAGGGPGLAIVGSYNPENGRLTWSQPAPLCKGSASEGLWEVWAQFFSTPSEDSEEQGVEANRILGTWQDCEGRRGNLELLLCEGASTATTYVVGDSFWARNGCEPFVYEQELPKPGPRRIGDKVFVPMAELDQTMIDPLPAGGSKARAPARLGGSIIEDSGNTLV